MKTRSLSRSYADWVDSRRTLILAIAVLVAAGGALLSSRLALKPDLSTLLPPSAESVRHLNTIKARARSFGTVFVIADGAGDPILRERAARQLRARIASFPQDLVSDVVFDDKVARDYFWENRFLFAPLEDLREAESALAAKIRREKLKANPLYIDLEDEPDPGRDAGDPDERLKKLRKRFDDAEKKAKGGVGFISDDKRLQLLVIRTPFASSDFGKGRELRRRLASVISDLESAHPGLDAGMTGNVILSLDENEAVVRGMATSAAITVLICALALFLYYRSFLPVLTSLWSLAVGTLATFAFAEITIGHLNLVTAFLAAIVVGNGINSGLILLARYFEELRAGREGNAALGRAIGGAARGTLAASIAAGVAYGSLVVTDFRGFRHFGVIGFVGMVLCWIAAFTILPAGLAVLARRGLVRTNRAPVVGKVLAKLLPARLPVVVVVGFLLTLVSLGATWHFVTSDPLQKDWSDLRPSGTSTAEARIWSDRLNASFTTKFQRGLSQRFVIGVERREQARELVERLRAIDRGAAAGSELLSDVTSLDDLVPQDQGEKLKVIAGIRELLADDLVETFGDDDRALLARVTPPASIEGLRDVDVPDALAWPFVERDGTRGRLILATSSLRFKTWNVFDRMEFASKFRQLELPEGAVVGGQSFIFADIVHAMGRDGPRATLVALIGAIVAVVLIVGFRRHGLVTLACAVSGILGMVALVSLAGLKVNVVDFIALPITIGLGIDYAVNLAVRDREDGELGPRYILSTTGGAVLLCAFTTMVGYGSLLLSDSGGIRSFGLAAILGELTCVFAALALAPTLLALLRKRSQRPAGG